MREAIVGILRKERRDGTTRCYLLLFVGSLCVCLLFVGVFVVCLVGFWLVVGRCCCWRRGVDGGECLVVQWP